MLWIAAFSHARMSDGGEDGVGGIALAAPVALFLVLDIAIIGRGVRIDPSPILDFPCASLGLLS